MVKQKSGIMTNKAFSLLELLVTAFIIAVLGLIGWKFYTEQLQSSYVSWAKAEMIDILKLAKVAKDYDGFYHQYIYAIGYRPKGKIFASVGTAADPSSICCSDYPNPGTNPCEKNWRSGFLYYNCDASTLHTATDNIEICDDSGYSYSCDKDTDGDGNDLKALQTSDFSTCTPSPATWCDCDNFTVGAIIFFGKKLTLNDQQTLCEGS